MVPDGKNWVPFVYNDELHFIYNLQPLQILKADHLTGVCEWVPIPIDLSDKVPDVSCVLELGLGLGLGLGLVLPRSWSMCLSSSLH